MGYTVTLNGLTVGAGTQYEFAKAPTGFGQTARKARQARSGGGTIPAGKDVPEARDMTIELDLLATSDAEAQQLSDALLAAWAPTDLTLELTMEIGPTVRVRRGRPTSCDVDLELLRPGFMPQARCVFDATDPLWYGDHSNVTVAAGVVTGGFVSPFVSPFVSTGTPVLSDVSVYNSGTAPADWTAQIIGPVTTPLLILNGRGVQINIDIPAGSIGYLDSRTRSFILDGAVRPVISHLSNWWKIPQGASTFSFRAAAGTGGATLDFQSTWY